MRLINDAIKKKLHISGNEKIDCQTWEDFGEIVQGKDLFCFGVSETIEVLLKKIDGRVTLSGIIDNSAKKRGRMLGEYVSASVDTEYENMIISDISVIKDKKNAVVVITSTNYYMQIINQLSDYGVLDCFVLLTMEFNSHDYDDNDNYEDNQRYISYAKECTNKPIDNNKIVFYSFGTYSDHGKYICEQLIKQNTKLDLVWFVKDLDEDVPDEVRKVYVGNWKKYIYELETAKVWIFNMPIQNYIIKRNDQIYIQTKHWASITLKKFYLDSSTIQDDADKVKNWKYNGKIIDCIFTGSKFDTESSQRGFGIDGKTKEIGSPRTDGMFMSDCLKNKVIDYYNLPKDSYFLIYAPTYRFIKKNDGYVHESRNIDLNFSELTEALVKRFGGEWIILLRLHPSVSKYSKNILLPNNVIDVSSYSDSEELVAASDIMISDYSSIMFETAFVKKPVFLFASDKEFYINQEYDFLLEYNELPFPIAETNDELVEKIIDFDNEKYIDRLNSFFVKYGINEDGHASERAAKHILKLMND